MIVGLGFVGFGFTLFMTQYIATIPDETVRIFDWVAPCFMAVGFLWAMFRVFVATPSCPSCSGSKVIKMGIYTENEPGHFTPTRWRKFGCPECRVEFLIPAMSMDG
jgi:protein-S-isoprenylcysteine O-methyltransferase Ste14